MKIEIKKELIGITIGAEYWGIVGRDMKTGIRVCSLILESLDWDSETFMFSTSRGTEVFASKTTCERLVFENEEQARKCFNQGNISKGLLEFGGCCD